MKEAALFFGVLERPKYRRQERVRSREPLVVL